MISKKRIPLSIVLCALLMSHALIAKPMQDTWYKNGWKFAAASYGFWAACSTTIAAYLYINCKKLNKEKRDSIVFDPRLNEELKISKACAPYFLSAGVALGLAASLLYRHGASKR